MTDYFLHWVRYNAITIHNSLMHQSWYTACFWIDITPIIRLSIMKTNKTFITIYIVQFYCLWCLNVRIGHSVRIWKRKTLTEIICYRSPKSIILHLDFKNFPPHPSFQKDWLPTFSNWHVHLKFRDNPA